MTDLAPTTIPTPPSTPAPPPGAPSLPTPRPAAGSGGGGSGGAGGGSGRAVDTAISLYFRVTVDGHDLGSFTECQGLACEITMTQREEGGVNDYVHNLPGRLKYSNVTLTRPVNADSQKVVDWLSTMIDQPKRTTAEIVALDPEGNPLFRWSLTGVLPAKWKGPSFSVDTNKVATESLELAHHGFLRAG